MKSGYSPKHCSADLYKGYWLPERDMNFYISLNDLYFYNIYNRSFYLFPNIIKCITPRRAITWAACYRFSTWPVPPPQPQKAVGSEVQELRAKSLKTAVMGVNRRHVCTCATTRSVTFHRCTYLQCRHHFPEPNCGAQGRQWDSGEPSLFHRPVKELYVLRWPVFVCVSHGTFQIKCPLIPIAGTYKPTDHKSPTTSISQQNF